MSDTMGYCLNKNCTKFNILSTGLGHSESVYRCKKCNTCLSMYDYVTLNNDKTIPNNKKPVLDFSKNLINSLS